MGLLILWGGMTVKMLSMLAVSEEHEETDCAGGYAAVKLERVTLIDNGR
jgi:hypothetical protein